MLSDRLGWGDRRDYINGDKSFNVISHFIALSGIYHVCRACDRLFNGSITNQEEKANHEECSVCVTEDCRELHPNIA